MVDLAGPHLPGCVGVRPGIAVTLSSGSGTATLMAVTVELALLSRVSYGSLEITGSRLQGLLALLAEDPHVGCSASRLVDALWPEEQPEHPGKALQVLVSRARARLGPGVIVSTPGGYRLSLREDQIDASAVLLSAAEQQVAALADRLAEMAGADPDLTVRANAQFYLGRLRPEHQAGYQRPR